MITDVKALAQQLVEEATTKGQILCTAESCTGGGVAEAITAISGSSNCFECAFVTYANAAKMRMLGVQEDTLQQHGAVSKAVAEQMAQGALANSTATLSVAITGVAGPTGGTPEKPVGMVWFGFAKRDGQVQTQCCQFTGDRDAVRAQCVQFALSKLLEMVLG